MPERNGIGPTAVLVGALLLLAADARAVDGSMLPALYDTHSSADVAALVFGVLAGQRDVWLTDRRVWEADGRQYLAVVAEAARPADCNCARPVRLALLEEADGALHIVAAALLANLRDDAAVLLDSPLLGGLLGDNGDFRLRGTERLFPVVLERDGGRRPRARLTLFRILGRMLMPVFEREILDDPTQENPEQSGMQARLRMGELDPGGLSGYADIRFTETYFTRFAGDVVELDDRRTEIWVFGGDRFSLVQCEQTGPMGYGPCVQ